MYTLNSSESITSINQFSKGGSFKRRLYRKLMPSFINKKRIKEEFGIGLTW